jgi:diguanylate cyclase (GGDEF)-like protein
VERPSFLTTLVDGRVDALTGCLSYPGLTREIARELNRAGRSGDALSVCFIDLDDFKQVNTTYGHVRANELLATVGRLLRGGMRDFDSVSRFGGDEFVTVLPRTTQPEALTIARRLRERIAHAATLEAMSLSASIGVAEWIVGEPAPALLDRADAAMLHAKARGIGVSGPPATEA